MLSCGGQITSGYHQLKEMPISEVLYDLDICISIQQLINKQNNSGINIPTDMEWEENKING